MLVLLSVFDSHLVPYFVIKGEWKDFGRVERYSASIWTFCDKC